MIPPLLAQDNAWLSIFFSGRNALKWETIVNSSASPAWLEQVAPWIKYFVASGSTTAIVLPIFGPDGPRQWYGMAVDEAGANALGHELTAFIGPSFSNFRGYALQVDLANHIENALAKRFGRFVYRLEPVCTEACPDITQALQSYLALLQRRPPVPDRTQRPFGKVRAEFDRALLAGNEVDAQRLLDELVNSGRLDAEQQKYLEIRKLAGLGRQYQLAHDYLLIKSVLGLSLPAQTIADLIEALYGTYIAEIESSDDIETIIATFKGKISGTFGPLFHERKGVRHPYVLKAFLLYELAQQVPNRERCQAILSNYPEDQGRPLIERWVGRLPPEVKRIQTDLFDSAKQAFLDEDYGVTIQIAFEALPQEWAVSMLLRCALAMNNLEVARKVATTLDKVLEEGRQAWSKQNLSKLRQLQELSGAKHDTTTASLTHPESDWLAWASYVESGHHPLPPPANSGRCHTTLEHQRLCFGSREMSRVG